MWFFLHRVTVAKPYHLDLSQNIFTHLGSVHDSFITMPSMHDRSHHGFAPYVTYCFAPRIICMQVMCVGFPFGFPSLLCCMLLLSRMIAYVCYFTLTIDCPKCEAEYYWSLEFNYRYPGKFTFDHSSNHLCFILFT